MSLTSKSGKSQFHNRFTVVLPNSFFEQHPFNPWSGIAVPSTDQSFRRSSVYSFSTALLPLADSANLPSEGASRIQPEAALCPCHSWSTRRRLPARATSPPAGLPATAALQRALRSEPLPISYHPLLLIRYAPDPERLLHGCF
jgi:hypothetical protein